MSNPVKEMSRWDPLIVKIDEKLRAPCNHSTCSIFKVPSRFHRVNERAFEPEILSIGPYHRGKDNLKMMEEHKKRYLQELLQRRGESSVSEYVTAMIGVEGQAREFYDQSVSLGQDEFVEMLLLDGCFIVEFIRKYNNRRERGEDDPVFEVPWILSSIKTDTMLLENQLPFFVLRELFAKISADQNEEDFFAVAINFCQRIFRGFGNHSIPENGCKHLLDIMYRTGYQLPITRTRQDNDRYFIRNTKELKEAGIKFKKREGSSRLFDVVFLENGTIEIPCLKIYDETESRFRNLVAYEQCSQRKHLYVTDYITLMDCLISTEEDVQILRHSGIIENWLGDDGMVCSLFNKLGKNVILSDPFDFCYHEVFDGVKKHCNGKCNEWMAKLKHDYFNSPWALLSFLAAVALLLFTLVQTVFTVMSYFQKD